MKKNDKLIIIIMLFLKGVILKMEKLKKIIGIIFDGLILVWVLFIIFCVFILNNIDKTEVDNDIGIEEPTFSTTTTIEEE